MRTYACSADEHYLTIYARGCKYDLDKMKQKIENNYLYKAAYPQIFADWDPFNPEIQAILSLGFELYANLNNWNHVN